MATLILYDAYICLSPIPLEMFRAIENSNHFFWSNLKWGVEGAFTSKVTLDKDIDIWWQTLQNLQKKTILKEGPLTIKAQRRVSPAQEENKCTMKPLSQDLISP